MWHSPPGGSARGGQPSDEHLHHELAGPRLGTLEGQIGLGELELRLDLTPLGRAPCVPQFGTQFLKGPLERLIRLLVGLVVLLGLVTEPVQVKVQLDVALDAVDPRARAMVEQVCIREGSLQLAEREAGLRRREGKTVLKTGLQALARHYGIG